MVGDDGYAEGSGGEGSAVTIYPTAIMAMARTANFRPASYELSSFCGCWPRRLTLELILLLPYLAVQVCMVLSFL